MKITDKCQNCNEELFSLKGYKDYDTGLIVSNNVMCCANCGYDDGTKVILTEKESQGWTSSYKWIEDNG